MKTYEQWSARAKQLGWSSDQYSQAAYQGYVNNYNAQQAAPRPPASAPSSPAPTPIQPQQSPQVQQLQQSVSSLQSQIQQQADDYEAQLAKAEKMKPGDASKALNSTILTATTGLQEGIEKRKRSNFLTPLGG